MTERTTGGFFGPDLKIWWISSSFPCRGVSTTGVGSLGLGATFNLKAASLYASELPKDPITNLASSGSEVLRNCIGRSFCVCNNEEELSA